MKSKTVQNKIALQLHVYTTTAVIALYKIVNIIGTQKEASSADKQLNFDLLRL